MKRIIFIVILLSVSAALLPPANEISIITQDAGGAEIETVISWALGSAPKRYDDGGIYTTERFFSIERYISGDINDCLYIGTRNNHYTQPVTGVIQDWTELSVEAWHNVDEIFMNFDLGL